MRMLTVSRGTIAVGIATLVLGATALMPGSFGTALAQTGDPGSGGSPQSPTTVTPQNPNSPDPVVSTGTKDVEIVVPNTTATLTTTTGSVTTNVVIPPNALPSGATVEVAPITNMEQLEALGGLPAGVDIIAGVQINAGANGQAITGDFAAPVTISFSVPAPTGATPETMTVAYWTGSSWSAVTANVTLNSDGTLTVVASVTHFTTFAVMNNPNLAGFIGSTPVFSASGFAFAVFGGGTSAQLEAAAAKQGASGVWVQNARGDFQLLVVAGPAFLRTQFDAQFPNGLAASSSVTLTKPAR